MSDEDLVLRNNSLGSVQLTTEFMRHAHDNFRIGLKTLSIKNQKEYMSTFRMWSIYTQAHGGNQLIFELTQVEAFLTHNEWSFNTRKTRLAHIRKFAMFLALADYENEYNFSNDFGRLTLLKPKSLGGQKEVMKRTELTNKQIYRLFDSMSQNTYKDTRNRAILGLMLLGGLRASEIVSLKWEHIDFDNGTLLVKEGKGDKSLHIPLLGDLETLLKVWRAKLPLSRDFPYVCVWIRRGDLPRGQHKLATGVITRLVVELSDKTGIDFKPHDARRTIITSLLKSGASVADTRDFARHSSGETTLRYAQKTDASTLGTKLNAMLKYGGVIGDMKPSETSRYFECENGHGFNAHNPTMCPQCASTKLSHQEDMFD